MGTAGPSPFKPDVRFELTTVRLQKPRMLSCKLLSFNGLCFVWNFLERLWVAVVVILFRSVFSSPDHAQVGGMNRPGGWVRALGGEGVGVVGVELAEEAREAEAYRPEASCRVEG